MKKRKISSIAEGRKYMAKIFNTVIKNELQERFAELNLKFHLMDIKFLPKEEAHRILTKGSHDESLEEFNRFQQNELYDNVAQKYDAIVGFIHTKYFGQSVVGYAYTGTVGNILDRKSMSGIVDSSRPFLSIAVTATHEIGHILGMSHEDNYNTAGTCNDPAGCIMSASHAQGRSDYEWSQYAKNYARDNLYRVDRLYDPPRKVYGEPVCGNGVVEDGEECDCGEPICPCCDSCRKPPSAECTGGDCCDLETCELKKSSAICKESRNACEPDIYCSGEDSFCAASVFYRNGFQCGKNKICYEGECKKDRAMEDYDGLIPDGYEEEMCDMSCGERLLCVFDGYLPTCIAPLPEDLCSSRGDPLTDNKCDCECGFTGENCKEKVFCKSKFIFWLCFSSGMLLLLIGVGTFIYFKFIKNDIEESITHQSQSSRTENTIQYNAGRPQRAAPSPPISKLQERYTAPFTPSQKPAPIIAKKVKKTKKNQNTFQDSGNKRLLPLFLALFAIFFFDRINENCRIEVYESDTQMVFIGGIKGSGTEYIRDLLDTSSDINCQKSTIGSPALLWMVFNELRRDKEKNRLSLAGISEELIFKAAKEGILEIIFGTKQQKIPYGLVYWNESVTIVDEYCKKYHKRCISVEFEDFFQHSNIIARKIGKFLKIDLDRNWKPDPFKIFPQKNKAGSTKIKKIMKKFGEEAIKRTFFLLSNIGWKDNLKYEENLDSFERPKDSFITEKEQKIIDDLVKNHAFFNSEIVFEKMTFLLISAPVAIFGWAYALWSLLAFASFLVNGREYFPEISTIFPYSIDDESTSDGDFYSRILKNSLLFGFWGFHHSFMCRRSVKKLMNLPKDLEIPFYVIQSSGLFHYAMANWQSIPEKIFEVPNFLKTPLFIGYLFGFLFFLSSSFAFDHFEHFGLRQGLKMGKFLRFIPFGLVKTGHYSIVRHPLMSGCLLMMVCPLELTIGRILIAFIVSIYIFISVKYFEEADLINYKIGPEYEKYMKTTPAFIPNVFTCPFVLKKIQ
ncbi:unnamed protein product [Oikopleura dioica]|uniref:Uncharacterized protein n=1 Tax=Oikopleura dioica TaxID=34765 RepID=E4WTN5_OIKDI|nr:unnamed protein product [Oikopleura dioica]